MSNSRNNKITNLKQTKVIDDVVQITIHNLPGMSDDQLNRLADAACHEIFSREEAKNTEDEDSNDGILGDFNL